MIDIFRSLKTSFDVRRAAARTSQLEQSYARTYTESLEEKTVGGCGGTVVPRLPGFGGRYVEGTIKLVDKTRNLDGVVFVVINSDVNPKLAAMLNRGEKTIPQFLFCTPGEDG